MGSTIVPYPGDTRAAEDAFMTVYPAGRYGHRREPGRRRGPGLLVVLAVVVLLLVGAGVLFVRSQSHQVSSQVLSFTATDGSVRIVFQVSAPGGRAAVCTVRARDAAGAQVGSAQVPVPRPRSGQHSVQVSYTLTTRGTPTTGEVQSCQLADG